MKDGQTYSFSSYPWISFVVGHNTFIVMEKHLWGNLNLTIFQYLCECQFDDNLKFKNIINEEDADTMRLQPIGRDKDGLMYWYQLDQDHNVRMYIEEQDDQDGSSWKCIVRYLPLELFFTFICMFLTLISSLPEYNLWGLVILFHLWG